MLVIKLYIAWPHYQVALCYMLQRVEMGKFYVVRSKYSMVNGWKRLNSGFTIQSIQYLKYSLLNKVVRHPTIERIEADEPNLEAAIRLKKKIRYLVFNIARFLKICPWAPLNMKDKEFD